MQFNILLKHIFTQIVNSYSFVNLTAIGGL